MHRLTAYLRLPRTNYCEIASGFYSSNDVDIDEYVGNPEKKEKGVNTCREFRFKPCPVRMNRTDGDGLVGTQGNEWWCRWKDPGYLCVYTNLCVGFVGRSAGRAAGSPRAGLRRPLAARRRVSGAFRAPSGSAGSSSRVDGWAQRGRPRTGVPESQAQRARLPAAVTASPAGLQSGPGPAASLPRERRVGKCLILLFWFLSPAPEATHPRRRAPASASVSRLSSPLPALGWPGGR